VATRLNENTNRNALLRQYLPQAADLSGYSHAQQDAIAQRLVRDWRARQDSARRRSA
jgi:IS30 family transposase